jgi:hypothetical protein
MVEYCAKVLFLLGNDWFYSFNCNFSLFSFISHKKVVPLQQDICLESQMLTM